MRIKQRVQRYRVWRNPFRWQTIIIQVETFGCSWKTLLVLVISILSFLTLGTTFPIRNSTLIRFVCLFVFLLFVLFGFDGWGGRVLGQCWRSSKEGIFRLYFICFLILVWTLRSFKEVCSSLFLSLFLILFAMINFIFLVLWSNVENRRKFFELYAKKHDFDPYVAENWYSVSRSSVVATKVYFYYYYYFIVLLMVFREVQEWFITTSTVWNKPWWIYSPISVLINPNSKPVSLKEMLFVFNILQYVILLVLIINGLLVCQ